MDAILTDWLGEGLRQDMAWWQMALRAVVLFVWGVVLARLGGQRMFGRLAAFDIVLAVVLGSVLSRAITGNAPLLPAMAAATVLVALHWAMTRLALLWPAFGRLAKGREVCLVKDGREQPEEMRRKGITRHDLAEALRGRGIERPEQAAAVYLERSGEISVIPRQ